MIHVLKILSLSFRKRTFDGGPITYCVICQLQDWLAGRIDSPDKGLKDREYFSIGVDNPQVWKLRNHRRRPKQKKTKNVKILQHFFEQSR